MNRKTTDLAWAAGFIDGEGSIRIDKTYHSRKRSNDYAIYCNLRLNVVNTFKPSVYKVARIFGVGKVHITMKNTPGGFTMYRWVCTNKDAYQALILLSPYLTVKKNEANVGMAFYKNCLIGATTGKPLTLSNMRKRLFYYEKIIKVRFQTYKRYAVGSKNNAGR